MHQKYQSEGRMWNSKISWFEVYYEPLMWGSELLTTFRHLNREGAGPCPTLMDNATVPLMMGLESLTRISCITSSSQHWHIGISWELAAIPNYCSECRPGLSSLLACCSTVSHIQQTGSTALILCISDSVLDRANAYVILGKHNNCDSYCKCVYCKNVCWQGHGDDLCVCFFCACNSGNRGALVAPPYQRRQNNNCSPTVLKQKGMNNAPFPTNEQSRVTD